MIAVAQNDCSILILDESQEIIGNASPVCVDRVNCVQFSPSNRLLAVCSTKRTFVHDISTWNVVATIDCMHEKGFVTVRFNTSETRILLADEVQMIVVDLLLQHVSFNISCCESKIAPVFSADDAMVVGVSKGVDGQRWLTLWSAANGKIRHTFMRPSDVCSIALNQGANANVVGVGLSLGFVCVLDISARDRKHVSRLNTGSVTGIAYSSNGALFVSACTHYTCCVSLVDATSHMLTVLWVKDLKPCAGLILSAALSFNAFSNKILLNYGPSYGTHILEVETGAKIDGIDSGCSCFSSPGMVLL